MRFLILTTFLLLASCASRNGTKEGITFYELKELVTDSTKKNIDCGEFSGHKFVTKLDLVVCLSKLTPKHKQKVNLGYRDLPHSGPVVDHVFYLLAIGAVSPKDNFEFGSKDLVSEKEIEFALEALK